MTNHNDALSVHGALSRLDPHESVELSGEDSAIDSDGDGVYQAQEVRVALEDAMVGPNADKARLSHLLGMVPASMLDPDASVSPMKSASVSAVPDAPDESESEYNYWNLLNPFEWIRLIGVGLKVVLVTPVLAAIAAAFGTAAVVAHTLQNTRDVGEEW